MIHKRRPLGLSSFQATCKDSIMDDQQIIRLRLPLESHSIILVCGMFRPCIVLPWLGKVVQEFLTEHLNDFCINLIILEVVFNYCPHFNNNFELWLDFGKMSLI